MPLSLLKIVKSCNTMSRGLYSRLFSTSQRSNLPLNKSEISIRPLELFEFRKVLKNWAVKEGWNPGQYEYLSFYRASPNGHRGLFFDNKLIASLSSIRYPKSEIPYSKSAIRYSDLAYLGLYIVDPQYRNKGIGQILAKSTLKELADCSLIGINAVREQEESYKKNFGFVPSFTISRWSGFFTFKNNILEPETDMEIKIVGKNKINIEQLIEYDAGVFGVHRAAFLRKWIEMPESYLLVAIQNQKICGYALMIKCFQGYKLAPLFANNEGIAKKLYASFACFLKKPTLMQLDIPDGNQLARELAYEFNLARSFTIVRMYKPNELEKNKKEMHELIGEQNKTEIHAVTSLEMG
jgi:hypothetical protein